MLQIVIDYNVNKLLSITSKMSSCKSDKGAFNPFSSSFASISSYNASLSSIFWLFILSTTDIKLNPF